MSTRVHFAECSAGVRGIINSVFGLIKLELFVLCPKRIRGGYVGEKHSGILQAIRNEYNITIENSAIRPFWSAANGPSSYKYNVSPGSCHRVLKGKLFTLDYKRKIFIQVEI